MKSLGKMIMCGLLCAGSVGASAVQAEEYKGNDRWYATAGVGYLFLEKDEEVLGQQLYEIRVGKHLGDRFSAEVGFGGMPDVRNRRWRNPGLKTLDSDTWGYRFVGDALIHAGTDRSALIDPYLGVGGGIAVYDDNLEDGNNDLFIGAGPGTFINFHEDFFTKADYRVAMVGHDTEVNHQVLLSVGYKWGGQEPVVTESPDSDGGAGLTGAAITALEKVYFPFDSSELTVDAQETLKSNAAWLMENPDELVTIEGHCDERGTLEYNYALGQRRADSVFRYLKSLGVSEERLKTVSYGEEYPAVAGSNPAAWAQNRRAEFSRTGE